MKLALALLLVASTAMAGTVRLTWTASATPSVTNYVVRAVGPGTTNSVANVSVGTNLTCEIETKVAGVWLFAAAAEKDGARSDWSNAVLVDMPEAPTNARTVAVEATVELDGEKWTTAGYFRLRIVKP